MFFYPIEANYIHYEYPWTILFSWLLGFYLILSNHSTILEFTFWVNI